MAIVLVNGQQKGGVGKSTMNWCSAHTLSQNYAYSVLFIDTDFQESIYDMRQDHMELAAIQTYVPQLQEIHPDKTNSEIFEKSLALVKDNEAELFNFPIVKCKLSQIKETITANYSKYDIIIVDIAGVLVDLNGSEKIMMEFYDMVDIILAPLTPGNYDEGSALKFKEKMEALKKQRKNDEGADLDIWFYINKFSKNRRKTLSLVKSIENNNFPTLNTNIPEWDDFNDAAIEENSIIELAMSNPGTKNIWNKFMDEVNEIIKQYI